MAGKLSRPGKFTVLTSVLGLQNGPKTVKKIYRFDFGFRAPKRSQNGKFLHDSGPER